jgi:deoxycytidine triphosphate deaminase
MPLLNRKEIRDCIKAGELVLYPAIEDGVIAVEAASYDLRIGVVVWKEEGTDQIKQKVFDESKTSLEKPLTLKPGQMIFVVTHEELKLPKYIAGTVYSRNKLQKENILALNAGHVDPGYQGPIIIRLVNLGAAPWPFRLGDAVFTVVFHTVFPSDGGDRRSKKQMIDAATEAARNAFSNPFHDLYKDQVKKQLDEYYVGVETRLRDKFQDEFFRKNRVVEFLVYSVAALLVGLALITRIPWGEVWKCVKWFLGK